MTPKPVLLVGQPNVGKSVLFCHLTGMHIMVSNYAGTTVEFTEGNMEIHGIPCRLIDAPGTYGLQATNEAERVTVNLLRQDPSAVLCVLDALNLESSLHLLLEVLDYGLPTIVVLNRRDLAHKHGLQIDHRKLQADLGIPVIPTVAVDGEGIEKVRQVLYRLLIETPSALSCISHCSQGLDCTLHRPTPSVPAGAEAFGGNGGSPSLASGASGVELWTRAEELAANVSNDPSEDLDSVERDLLIEPWPGIPIALGIVGLMFSLVIGLGMGLRRFVFLPFFRGLLFPLLIDAVTSVVAPTWLRNVLIGDYGFLIKGLEWPFALVLPYVISFYLGLSVLEDWGYLPRLGVLLDGLLNKIGLNGSCIIPLLLGYGCGIPSILATRSLPSRKQRLIISAVVSFAVPCVSQTGAFIALLSERSLMAVGLLFLLSILSIVVVGAVLDRLSQTQTPYTLMEVPELLLPKPKVLLKKVTMRVRHYILEGALPMIAAVMFASLMYETGILVAAGRALAPLISGWLRLPPEAIVPLVLGIIRRELTVLPLIDMELTALQFMTGAVIALFYVPCIAMVAALAKEFGIKIAAAILLLTTFGALFFGGLLAQSGALLTRLMA